MADETHYEKFNMLNQEFTFDVDVSHLPCGLNGALYMSDMPADGGVSTQPNNKAGAQYGVGYCDSQCPRDLKFIGGEGNVEGWVPSSTNSNTGVGGHGACCAEMDIWEANSMSAAVTPHSCSNNTLTVCDGDACGGTYSTTRYAGECDPDGCDFNSYRMGNTTFYGPGMIVNTNEVFTVVTQFLTSTGDASGTMNEIKRFYVQNGVVIPNSQSTISGITGNSITETYCDATKTVFNNTNTWDQHGGFTSMTAAMNDGMVLVMSLWDDDYANMFWLDSDYPTTDSPTAPGIARGTCSTSYGVPATVESSEASSYVIYSNIKVGAINTTFSGGTSTTGTSPGSGGTTVGSTTPTTSSSSGGGGGGTAAQWAQCGGQGYTGPTTCASGSVCTYSNEYYSQCIPS